MYVHMCIYFNLRSFILQIRFIIIILFISHLLSFLLLLLPSASPSHAGQFPNPIHPLAMCSLPLFAIPSFFPKPPFQNQTKPNPSTFQTPTLYLTSC